MPNDIVCGLTEQNILKVITEEIVHIIFTFNNTCRHLCGKSYCLLRCHQREQIIEYITNNKKKSPQEYAKEFFASATSAEFNSDNRTANALSRETVYDLKKESKQKLNMERGCSKNIYKI